MARKVFISSDMSIDERLIEVREKSPQAALFWPWFLTVFDDWGRSEANAKRLKSQIFPDFDNISSDDIEEAIVRFGEAELITLYEVGGKRYMAVPKEKWFKYQTHIHRSKRDDDSGSRYPSPPRQTDTVSAEPREESRNSAEVRGESRDRYDNRTFPPSPLPPFHPSPSGEKEKPSPPPGGSDSSPPPKPTKPKKSKALQSLNAKYTPEFETFWREYPKKADKKDALQPFQDLVDAGVSPESLTLAARNYARKVRSSATEWDFIKHASTFLNKASWQDYVDGLPRGPTDLGDFSDAEEGEVDLRALMRERGSGHG